MMPLAPERNTLYMAAKPKADFSIDFIVGNGKKSHNNNNNNTTPPRKGSASPLSGRKASPPHYIEDRPPHTRTPESVEDEDEVRARLLGLHAAALPGAGALHGLLPPGALGLPLGLGLPRASPGEPSPVSPVSPRSPASPPQSPPQHMPQPPPFLFRSLYRPEPMLVSPQFQLQQQLLAQQEAGLLAGHPHLSHVQVHHGGHPGVHPGHPGGHPVHPHHPPNAPPKDSYPLYPWLLSRHGRIFPHRFAGGPDIAGFLLHPFRKPKRIRTAFSPSQLLKLEHAFENNHYVVGAERKQVAQALGLSETQVKVWFQNRRTKHKRTEQEEEAKAQRTSSNGGSNSNGSTTSSSGSNANPTTTTTSSTSSSATKWKEEDERCPPAPGSPGSLHRPVDLSSHDDSSDMESEC